MKRQALKIELLEDCVFSARSATEGGHESLDRIPGAALLGAAAARIYDKLGDKAFDVFHSGRLRFGDGLPWSGNGIGWPVPCCWHYPKTGRPDENGRLVSKNLYNFIHVKGIDGNKQPKQLRSGYVHLDGRYTRPMHSLRLKTAISYKTGRASEGQLFGYDALHQGQSFVSLLEADDDFEEVLFNQVIETLEGNVLLGRSRSAEYGRAKISKIPEVEVDGALDPDENKSNGHLILWLISDMAPVDRHGHPTLQIDGLSFGLPGARVVWDKTFLRGRRYSPWNAARHGYDRERLVLGAGGVITLELDGGMDRDKVIETVKNGVGLYREAGLGRLWIDPPLLTTEKPTFEKTQGGTDAEPEEEKPAAPNDPLVTWLKETAGIDWKSQAEEEARRVEESYVTIVAQSRRLHGIAPDVDYGPSRSQWGTVMSKARGVVGQALHTALFTGSNPVIRADGEGWNIEVLDDSGRYQTLADWIHQKLDPSAFEEGRAYAHFVRTLARRIQDRIETRRN